MASACVLLESSAISAFPHGNAPTLGLTQLTATIATAAAKAKEAARLDPAWTSAADQFAQMERGLRTNDSDLTSPAFIRLISICRPLIPTSNPTTSSTASN